MSVFPVKIKNMFIPAKRVYSMNIYSVILLSREGVSEVSERARERSVAKQA